MAQPKSLQRRNPTSLAFIESRQDDAQVAVAIASRRGRRLALRAGTGKGIMHRGLGLTMQQATVRPQENGK